MHKHCNNRVCWLWRLSRVLRHGARITGPHQDHGFEPDRQLRQLARLLLLELLGAPQRLDRPVTLAPQLLDAGLQLRQTCLPSTDALLSVCVTSLATDTCVL